MKKYLLLAIGCLSVSMLMAQTKKKPAATTKKTTATASKTATAGKAKPAAAAPTAPSLKSSADSFSYAIGLSIASFYKAQGVKDINNQLVLKALTDARNNKPLLNDQQVNNCIVNYMQSARSEKASGNKKAGEAFLAENKKKAGVVTTPSGLQYQVLKEGNGPKPTADDQVKVHYRGTLLDGTEFDSSIGRGEPITFGLKNVIPGWTEGVQLMPVGSKYRFFIPSNLAYGDNPAGPHIKEGSTLIFEVELLEIVK
jgi:FKBP-type peptidyl-prolyl cis-trans isomerase FklB